MYLTNNDRFNANVYLDSSIFSVQEYLLNVNDIKTRQIITQLRMNHSILKSSFMQKKKDNDVLCKCKQSPESVEHFLLNCNQYKQEREILYKELKNIYPIFHHLSQIKQISTLLSMKGHNNKYRHEIQSVIVTFIKNIYHKRCRM